MKFYLADFGILALGLTFSQEYYLQTVCDLRG